MTTTLSESAVVQAAAAARRVATQAGVEVRELSGLPELTPAAGLLSSVWSTAPDNSPLPIEVLRALEHAGSYVAGAYQGDRLVGVSAGFLGLDGGRLFLHSHILGVLPGSQNKHAGISLKLHQRAWALARGIDEICWTFDPLVRRNAFFNLTKLGADARTYHRSFYGAMGDGINAGDASDRVLASWSLSSPRALAASGGTALVPEAADLLARGAVAVLDVDEAGAPKKLATGPATGYQLIRTPEDIVSLRRTDKDLATAWRAALRSTFGGALDEGWSAVGVTRDGWYVLQR